MKQKENSVPWYRRVYRWGQTNITEIDPSRYDIEWWREHWRRTRVQGVVINAGGIVFYYPTRHRLGHQALYLNERDLYGELAAAAHEMGLAVFARMDSNRVHESFFIEHPDWIARDAEGIPYRAGELYVTCINSPYYHEFLPSVLREIIERTHPEGITDNSYSGLDRQHICYCSHCRRKFRQATGMELPKSQNWSDPAFRQWIKWSYGCRLEIWDLNNRTARDAGGEHCLWVGMTGGNVISQSLRFRDYKGICERSELLMLDNQSRGREVGFQSNAEAGKLVHGLLGWDKLTPESLAMYGHSAVSFRVASKPEPEARMWALEAFAGTIQPWWHHIGAYHEDRRQYRTAEPLFRWHEENQEYLTYRRPVANVGVVWSQENVDFYGQDVPSLRVALPWVGIIEALIRYRIPYVPVHADHIERHRNDLDLIILPNVGALSDSQCRAIKVFVSGGGSLIATGETSRYNEWGDPRDDFGLADVFGAHCLDAHHGSFKLLKSDWDDWRQHTYLRLAPELRAGVYGPQTGSEPKIEGSESRHPVLAGFEETDILPFGGRIEVVQADDTVRTPLTFVPPFPIFPPETSWMRVPKSSLAALVLRENPKGSRVAFLTADIDRCFARGRLPDHALLIQNIVRWALKDSAPLTVEGVGLLDCHLYSQPGRLILHLVNLTNTAGAPLYEIIPIGPTVIRVKLPDGVRGSTVRSLVSKAELSRTIEDGCAVFTIDRISDHEVLIIE